MGRDYVFRSNEDARPIAARSGRESLPRAYGGSRDPSDYYRYELLCTGDSVQANFGTDFSYPALDRIERKYQAEGTGNIGAVLAKLVRPGEWRPHDESTVRLIAPVPTRLIEAVHSRTSARGVSVRVEAGIHVQRERLSLLVGALDGPARKAPFPSDPGREVTAEILDVPVAGDAVVSLVYGDEGVISTQRVQGAQRPLFVVDEAAVQDSTDVVVESDRGDSEITEPFNPALIRVETKPLIIDALIKRISHNEIDLTPDFQRQAGIWTPEAQSRLIESILIQIPLPAFYLDATDDERWVVVDGLQRLSTLKSFVIDETLRLCGLEYLTKHTGKTFRDLPRSLQRRIEETQVIVFLIEKGTPPEVKFDIFKRINTGGLPLSAQEIRHALNQGPCAELLERLSESASFLTATDGSIRDSRMADRECVLRFLAFVTTPPESYPAKHDLDSFLNTKMRELNTRPHAELQALAGRFDRSMRAAAQIFGKAAFRKKYAPAASRYPINKALFEAWSVNLDRLSDEQLARAFEHADEVVVRFMTLMKEREFDLSISQATGDPRKIRYRFRAIAELLQRVIEAK